MKLEVEIEKAFDSCSLNFDFTMSNNSNGVFGPSGSGKSTLMMMLAGLCSPDRGRITLNNSILFDSSTGINLPPEKRRIGVVFQHSHLFPHMTVKKNLLYGYKRTAQENRNIDPTKLIALLQLKDLLQRKVPSLSGGERQRVALARTLLTNPQLMLLDEPLSGLDEELKYQIIPYLKEVFSQLSIPHIFISHSIEEMRVMTQEVLVVQKGRVKEQVSSEDLARQGLGSKGKGYLNLLQLPEPVEQGHLLAYQWGDNQLMRVQGGQHSAGQYCLSSRDILLCKKHPGATSARNALPCTVSRIYTTDWLVGVELFCGSKKLIAEIVPQSVAELGVQKGAPMVALFKASAIQKLY